MRKSRFAQEQTAAVLRRPDRTSLTEAARKNKVSMQVDLLLA